MAHTVPELPVDAPVSEDLKKTLEELDYSGRAQSPKIAVLIGLIGAIWSLFQFWIASPIPYWLNFGIVSNSPARSIHLAFALLLVFLIFPFSRKQASDKLPLYDVALALLACGCALYPFLFWDQVTTRAGTLLDVTVFGLTIPFEALVGWAGMLCLLEGTRRGIGLPLVVVASIFLLYSVFGQSMPDLISHKGVSMSRLAGYQWLTNEAIFGIPIEVATKFVFVFVLFGALLETAGAGRFFLNLAFALVGRYTGGPAKATILSSGLMGMISGSSVANVVTCGTFTIPVMTRMGMPAVKAGAIEVAAGVDGQIMPPVMGAAAFIIAEFVGITYKEVCIAAFAPAVMSYISLFYMSHLESVKLGLRGMPESEIPPFFATLKTGLHYVVPVVLLIYLLLWVELSAERSVWYSIMLMLGIILWQKVQQARRQGAPVTDGLKAGFVDIYGGFVKGARNMITISLAVGSAGIIVGAVSATGLNNALVAVVEVISGGNLYILLVMVAVLSLILGMGLPTTANYVVVASLLAPVVVELGNASGVILPLLAVHLYVFYFGLMADVTPPVCLAAFAASAISRADPMKTGLQGFYYSIRTAILPAVFLFNVQLLFIDISTFWHGLMVFVCSLTAILVFSAVAMRYMFSRLKIWEMAAMLVVVFGLFRPDVMMNQIYPDFSPYNLTRLVAGEAQIDSGRDVRFHVTRETEYGERFRLYRIDPPLEAKGDVQKVFGIELKRDPAGNFRVVSLTPNGLAEKRGILAEDLVTAADVENLNRPAKEWVYPFMLALLGLIMGAHYVRSRNLPPPVRRSMPA